MKVKMTICAAMCGSFLALVASSTNAQILYSENFDDGQASTRWTAHAGIGYSDTSDPVNQVGPMDTNFDTLPLLPSVDGVNDDLSGFAFDYSVAGIPPAPGSTSTIGLKLQSNLSQADLGGFSVNPNGLDLNALSNNGDYSVTFYAWSSTLGGTVGFPTGGSGSTNLSSFGILTAGTESETLLNTDGVWFAYTGDGGSSADYRAYSSEESDSYDSSSGEPRGVYHAGGRNGTAQLYVDAVGGAITVPQSVKDAFPTQNMEGTLSAGAAAFKWHHNEIRKVGDKVEWYVNGLKLITIQDLSQFDVATGGGNISFGHHDINYTASTDALAVDMLFTLIDNIVVTEISTIVENANFDGDDDVDGRDFLTWQRGFGINDGTALLSDGDANGDGNVDGDDLIVWQAQYGEPIPPLSAVTSVPEPASATLFGALLAFFGLRRPAFGFARSR
jgi:hypothetical protein